MEALRKDVKDYPDLYQHERAKKFGVGQSTIFYALKRLNISNKKKRYTILNQIGCLDLYFNLRYSNMSL